MKPSFKTVIPRGARKLSTASTSSIQPSTVSLLFFEPGSSPSYSSPQPRIISPSLALTTTNASTTATSKVPAAHPRYTTNASQPTFQSIPPLFFLPPPQAPLSFFRASFNSQNSEKSDRHPYKLDMGAYGIPKRRKGGSNGDSAGESSQHGEPSSQPSTSNSPSPPGKDDPAAYHLAVQVGEDAYFTRADALGVADGVGGWKHSKHYTGESHSALLAKKLMHFCSLELSQGQPDWQSPAEPTPSSSATAIHGATPPSPPPSSTPNPDPIKILQNSYDRCIAEAQAAGHVTGSTTALLAVLVDNELRVAHLGDCAMCLVRDGEMIYRSEEMQHSFNYPFQLGPKSSTTPEAHAQRITIPVQPNDILILASDGMGDNLWDEDVLDEVKRFIGPRPHDLLSSQTSSNSGLPRGLPGPVTNGVLAQRLSEALASRAKRVSGRTSDFDTGGAGAFAAKPRRPSSSLSELRERSEAGEPTITVGAESSSSARAAQRRAEAAKEQARLEEEDLDEEPEYVADEVPFGRKAKEAGLRFMGGKNDDISVLVAIISGSTSDVTTSSGIHPQLNLHLDRSLR